MKQSRRILGIDPGLRIVGYGCLKSDGDRHSLIGAGVIKTNSDRPIPERLEALYDSLSGLIRELKPEIVSIEKLFFFRNITSAVGVCQAQGVLMLACRQAGLEILEYTPLQIKIALTGYGRADKKQVQAAVQKTLGLEEPPKPADCADALGAALTLALELPPAA